MPAPAFQFYPDDFVGSGIVQAAEADEIGAYMLLLCLDWGEEGFAFDEKRLARVCRLSLPRFRVVWSHLAPKFPLRDGKHYNTRLDKERKKQAEWLEKSRKGAATTNEKRWGKGRQSDEMATATESPERSPIGRTPVSISNLQSPLQPQTTLLAVRKKREPKPSRDTWLTPAGLAWEAVNGKGSFPYGQAGREFEDLHKHHTAEEIGRRLAWYLANKGSEQVLTADKLKARQWTPNLRDFRLRFGQFDPSAEGDFA